MTDFSGPEGGRLAVAFATGCTSTYVFMRNLVMKPAIRSCHERVKDLEGDRDRLITRVGQLEAILLHHGPGDLRNAMQAALSERSVAAGGAA